MGFNKKIVQIYEFTYLQAKAISEKRGHGSEGQRENYMERFVERRLKGKM